MIYLLINAIVCLVISALLFVFSRKNMLLFLCLLHNMQFVLLFVLALVIAVDDAHLIRQAFMMCVLLIACIILFFFNQKYKPLSFFLLLLPLVVVIFINMVGGYFIMS